MGRDRSDGAGGERRANTKDAPSPALEGRGYEGAGYGRGHYPRGEPGGRGPSEPPGRGYYGSGGSYGYGGGFEHAGQRGYRGEPPEAGGSGWGREEFYEMTGGFGYDTSAHGLSHAARAARFSGHAARGPFYGRAPQGYARSDQRIREDLCDQLCLGHIDPSEISVDVTRGVVTLEGFVSDRRDKYYVEELADATLGVLDVDNRLRIRRESEAREGGDDARERADPSARVSPRRA